MPTMDGAQRTPYSFFEASTVALPLERGGVNPDVDWVDPVRPIKSPYNTQLVRQ